MYPPHLQAHHEGAWEGLPPVKHAGPLQTNVRIVKVELLPGKLTRAYARSELVDLPGRRVAIVQGFQTIEA